MVGRIFAVTIILSTIFLSGCSLQSKSSFSNKVSSESQTDQTNQISKGRCQSGPVTLEGYGDKGKKLANCFIEYPGEPSRQDKSYYIIEDICGQFTQDFIQNTLGKSVTSLESSKTSGLNVCTYYLDDSKKEYVMLALDYLKMENQKIGQEAMGRRTEVSSKIPMKNMVVWQPDGFINNIYLVLGDEKFIRIERSSSSILTADELVGFAANIAKEISQYK